MQPEPVGHLLKKQREAKRMSLAEVARITRIPATTLVALERGQFDSLPGEVFVRGFLRSYAQTVGIQPDEALARYTASRRIVHSVPMQVASSSSTAPPRHPEGARRLGIAMAFVVLLLLFTLALSIVLKPRGHDMPAELSAYPACPARAPLATAAHPSKATPADRVTAVGLELNIRS